jgi:hypothetical protein
LVFSSVTKSKWSKNEEPGRVSTGAYLVAEATEKRVAAPTPRRADSEGIVMISVTNDRIDITVETRGGRVRLYKTTREQIEEGVGEKKIQKGDSQVYQSAPDTVGVEAVSVRLHTLSERALASLEHSRCILNCSFKIALYRVGFRLEALGTTLAATAAGTRPSTPIPTEGQL